MPDKKADSTAGAIKHFMGEQEIERFYSDRSGEIERALRDLHSVSDTSQPGFPNIMQSHNALCNMCWKELGLRCCEPGYPHASGSMHASITA